MCLEFRTFVVVVGDVSGDHAHLLCFLILFFFTDIVWDTKLVGETKTIGFVARPAQSRSYRIGD
jgi:hypothetical protein